MAKVICKDYELEKKCGCGFRFNRLYAFSGDEKNFDEVGLCGQCFAELLEEFGYNVLQPNQRAATVKEQDDLYFKRYAGKLGVKR